MNQNRFLWLGAALLIALITTATVYWLTDNKLRSRCLGDGTEALYFRGTHIKLVEGYPKNREIGVDGEALLHVAEATQPLTIRTRLLILTVTGKSTLRVNAYADKTGEQVDVLSGHVHAIKSYESRFDEPADLEAGGMVMINSTIDLMEEETFDEEEQRAWSEKFGSSLYGSTCGISTGDSP